MMKIIGVLAMLTMAASASAELPTIFGQPLGKPLIYPLCKSNEQSQKDACYTHTEDPTAIIIEIPQDKVPNILVINKFVEFLVNGNVEIILADTIGDWQPYPILLSTNSVRKLLSKTAKPSWRAHLQALF